MPAGGPPTGIVGAVALVATLAGVLLWVLILAGPYRLVSGLLDGGRHLEQGENALSNTSLKQAQFDIFAGQAAVRRARRALDAPSPLLDVARLVPRVDAALGEVDHLVDASRYSAKAARGTLKIAKNALRGPTRIIAPDPDNPENSLIRLDRVEEIGGSISTVRSNLDGVQEELGRVDLQDLPRRARDRVREGITKAADAAKVLADAEAGFAILPAVLGASGERTYLIGMQNTAEQRGTGGAILRFATVTFDNGASDFGGNCKSALKQSRITEKKKECAGESVYAIDKYRQTLRVPLPKDAWYVREIEDAQRFGNANWSPDWPLSAKVMIAYAEAADDRLPELTFPEIDGFIGLDPVVMERLIPGTGSYRIEFGNHIKAKSAVHFLLYRAYAVYPDPPGDKKGARRWALKQVVDGFIEKLLNPKHPTELVTGMSKSLADKHMFVWMKDPEEQAFIKRMAWDAAISKAKKSDYLFAVEQNVGGNKFDYYSDYTTQTDIRIEGKDALRSTELSVHNGTFFPQPTWAMGDSGKRGPNGQRLVPTHEPMMNLYVPGAAVLSEAEVTGERIDSPRPAAWVGATPPEHLERGKKVWSATLQIPPQEEGSVRFDYRVPDVVQERNGRSSYRLVVQHQPRVRPELLRISLALPDDASAIVAPGWKRTDDGLVWEKPLNRDLVLEVTWE